MLAAGCGFLVIYGEYFPLCYSRSFIWATIDHDKVFRLSFIVHYISVYLLLSPAFSKYALPSLMHKPHPTSRKIQFLFSKVVKKEQYYLGELQACYKNDRNELLLYIAITDETTSERFVTDLWGENGVFSHWNESLKFTIFQKILLQSPWKKNALCSQLFVDIEICYVMWVDSRVKVAWLGLERFPHAGNSRKHAFIPYWLKRGQRF